MAFPLLSLGVFTRRPVLEHWVPVKQPLPSFNEIVETQWMRKREVQGEARATFLLKHKSPIAFVSSTVIQKISEYLTPAQTNVFFKGTLSKMTQGIRIGIQWRNKGMLTALCADQGVREEWDALFDQNLPQPGGVVDMASEKVTEKLREIHNSIDIINCPPGRSRLFSSIFQEPITFRNHLWSIRYYNLVHFQPGVRPMGEDQDRETAAVLAKEIFPETTLALTSVGTFFTVLPIEITGCKELTQLKLKVRGLRTLSQRIKALTALTLLDLSDSRDLESLPEGIGELENLKVINLSNTNIATLPLSMISLSPRKLYLSQPICDKIGYDGQALVMYGDNWNPQEPLNDTQHVIAWLFLKTCTVFAQDWGE